MNDGDVTAVIVNQRQTTLTRNKAEGFSASDCIVAKRFYSLPVIFLEIITVYPFTVWVSQWPDWPTVGYMAIKVMVKDTDTISS